MRKLFSLLFVFFCFASNACTCIGTSTVRGAVSNSDVVVSGKIISEKVFTVKEWPNGKTLDQVEYKLLVSKVFKGSNITDTLRIITGVGDGDCGIKLSVGKKYIVYTQYADKYFPQGELVKKFLHTDACTRTQLYNKKEADEIVIYTQAKHQKNNTKKL